MPQGDGIVTFSISSRPESFDARLWMTFEIKPLFPNQKLFNVHPDVHEDVSSSGCLCSILEPHSSGQGQTSHQQSQGKIISSFDQAGVVTVNLSASIQNAMFLRWEWS